MVKNALFRRTTSVTPALDAMREISAAFNMSTEESERFVNGRIARLIAILPFAARAARPERTAITHLGTYVLSVRDTRHVFFATEDDDHDVFARLDPIARFEGGDADVIKKGLAYLARTMVIDYARDAELDSAIGKHNPVATGAWDPEPIMSELSRIIETVDAPLLDEVMDDESGVQSFWSW